ncbi:unnamed protein product [marine sediment metagenome]|uniref:Uncharacterized protein n=1 Tax=marine sediment metagenome TaxID=412755 RepID=X1RI14_9ZZZZ
MKKKLLIGLGSLVGICIIIGIIAVVTTTEEPAMEKPEVEAFEKEPDKGGKVEEVLEEKIRPPTFESILITGSSDKTSPPFRVTTKEWVIDWSYVPDPEWAAALVPGMNVFGFFVYPRGETVMYVESVMFPEGTSGTIYSYAGAGEYYIQVIGNAKSWEVVISPP